MARNRRKSILLAVMIPAVTGVLLLVGFAGWNSAHPDRTCASCHEIVPSLESWETSAHREVTCSGCHGSAFGNGFHSLGERAGMVWAHAWRSDFSRVVRLDEEDVLEVMESCVSCHMDEYKSWMAGGHSATYGDVFLNETHNRMERLYPDCLRCHGMYYGGTISDLVGPISLDGPWRLKQEAKGNQPVIPCLACHPIHMENTPLNRPGSLSDPEGMFYEREERAPLTGLFLRSDRLSLRSDMLRKPEIFQGEQRVSVSDDPIQRLCIQCHSPNWSHQAGTEDDRTPTGVHEGISCRSCHPDHSNNALNSCGQCHPAISNCGLDVKAMNTSYRDRDSPHDIHFMKCTDCHDPIPET